jgi:hypothetical protein
MARELWRSDDAEEWRAALGRYAAAMDALQATKKRVDIRKLDARVFTELVGSVAKSGCLSKAELEEVVTWKLNKGKMRPIFHLIHGLEDGAVRAATGRAVARLRTGLPSVADAKAALDDVCTLRGVGPATGSAVLCLASDSVPFMADEALEAVLGTRAYTVPEFEALTRLTRAKAAALAAAEGSEARAPSAAAWPESLLHEPWSARLVHLALWAAERAPPAAAGSKRARDAPAPDAPAAPPGGRRRTS